MEKPIDDEIKGVLEARKGDWLAIAKQANVSHSWLSKFVNGHIPNPGLTTLRKVRDAIDRIDKRATAQDARTQPKRRPRSNPDRSNDHREGR